MAEFLWVFVAIFASMSWGVVYVLDKKVLESFSVIEMLLVYHTVAVVSIWAIWGVTERGKGMLARLTVPENFKWMVLTVVVAFLANLLILKSIQLSNATLAAIVEVSYPLFTVLFAYLFFKQNVMNWDVAIGGSLILAGVLWISLRA